MTRFARVAILVCALQTVVAALASAQGILQQPTLPNPEDQGRFNLGFVRFTPSISVTNLGVDTNVFNELEDPKEDFTVSFGPKAEFWSRLGPRGRLYGNTGVDYQYFQDYDSQRSFGTSNIARLDYDLGRLMPFVEGEYTNTRVRPGYEIDARARHEDISVRAGVSVRVQSKTRMNAWVANESFRYKTGEELQDVRLSVALDRDTRLYGGGVEIAVTPLTTFQLNLEQGQDRFVLSPERDADTFKVLPGFRFKPFALIDGSLFVGYRQFETLSPLVPDFGGVIAQIDLGYTLRRTRVSGNYNRDVTYSFDTIEPYYLQTDWAITVVQKITSTWDIVARGGRYRLDYEMIAVPGATRRTDTGIRYGGGIGYTLGEYIRLGVDVNYMDRKSEADITRNYEGVRGGFSVTYGQKQR